MLICIQVPKECAFYTSMKTSVLGNAGTEIRAMSDMPQYSFADLRDDSSGLVRSQSELDVSHINNTIEGSSSEPGNPDKECYIRKAQAIELEIPKS